MNCGVTVRMIAAFILLAARDARGDTVKSLIQKGDGYDQRLESRQALEAYLAAQKLGPPNAELLRRIAKKYGELMADTDSADQKRVLGEQALASAKQAVAIDPNDAMAQLALAVCYGRLAPLLDNKTKIAYSRLVEEHAERSLALDPCNDLTYNVLGSWNYELASLNPFLRTLAGMIYGQVPDASYDESVKDFQKAVQLNPGRLANHIGLGRAYAALGRKTEAKEEIQRGLAMPDHRRTTHTLKNRGGKPCVKFDPYPFL